MEQSNPFMCTDINYILPPIWPFDYTNLKLMCTYRTDELCVAGPKRLYVA